jgi:uncharacterized protein YndB with AHSA1/START domain
MARDAVTREIAADPETVWEVVADFGGLARWLPGVSACTLDGDVRHIELGGITLREERLECDPDARRLRYRIIDGAPVETHEAVLTVAAADGGCRVTWELEVRPDEMAPLMLDVYRSGLDALAAHVGG